MTNVDNLSQLPPSDVTASHQTQTTISQPKSTHKGKHNPISWEERLLQDFPQYTPEELPQGVSAQEYYNLLQRTNNLNKPTPTKETLITHIKGGKKRTLAFIFPIPPLHVADNFLLPDLFLVKIGEVIIAGWNNRATISGIIPSIESFRTYVSDTPTIGPIPTDTVIANFDPSPTRDYINKVIESFLAFFLNTSFIFFEKNPTSLVEQIYDLGYRALPYSIEGSKDAYRFSLEELQVNSDILQVLDALGEEEWRQLLYTDYPIYFTDALPEGLTYEKYYDLLARTRALVDIEGETLFHPVDPEHPMYPLSLLYPIPRLSVTNNQVYGDIVINSFDEGQTLVVGISQREMVVGLVPPVDVPPLSETSQADQEHMTMLEEGGYQTMVIQAADLIPFLREAERLGYLLMAYSVYSVELSPSTIDNNQDLFE